MTCHENIVCKVCKARTLSIFSELASQEMDQLALVKKYKFYKRGEELFKEGTYPKGLFCVQSGKIKVSQIGPDGKEQIVHLISSGNIMGHRAIFSDDHYSCSAIAMEDSHVCFIPKADFSKMLDTNPKLVLKIAHLLSVELKEAEQKITFMAQQPVKERLAQVLNKLIDRYGFKEDNCTINLTIKREDIANLAGTSRETATRLLYDLQHLNIIELSGKYIKVIDKKGLGAH
ncbi:MAG: Crp/Fnr family transcriptional regulator [Saprospiraceae bacterium]|nr:Crp/Fnr family transcriptional regulator [Saprospiraceae bacterium]